MESRKHHIKINNNINIRVITNIMVCIIENHKFTSRKNTRSNLSWRCQQRKSLNEPPHFVTSRIKNDAYRFIYIEIVWILNYDSILEVGKNLSSTWPRACVTYTISYVNAVSTRYIAHHALVVLLFLRNLKFKSIEEWIYNIVYANFHNYLSATAALRIRFDYRRY